MKINVKNNYSKNSIVNSRTNSNSKTDKKISFNLENNSTAVNMRTFNTTKKDKLTPFTKESVLENGDRAERKERSIKKINQFIPSSQSKNNIKQEMFKEVGNNIRVFSPSSKTSGNILTFGGLPKVNKSNEKYSFMSVQSSHSNNIVPKKLTKKQIEIEKKRLKSFMENSVFGIDEKTLNKNLRISKVNKHATKFQEFMMNRRLEKQEKEPDKENMKRIENIVLNPSLGPEYLRKKYSGSIPKDQLWNFENKFKSNYSKHLLGSILFAKRVQTEDDSKKYENIKNAKFTQVSKLKMKWKTIKYILDHKKDVLDRLMDFHENILKISNKHSENFDKGLTKSEFTAIMKRHGITNDIALINKLFWVFDEDGDNDLRYKEIAFGIEMFRDSSIEQKLKAFFDLCDADNSGSISKQEFFHLMKKNIINNDERISMKDVVDKIFSSVKLDKNGDITFEKLKEGCEKNKEIQDIIYKNLLALKSIDNVIDRDVKNDIMRFNPELNDALRMKLLSMRISYTPLREEKFTKLLNNFVANKEKHLEMNKLREVSEENSFDINEEETSFFKEERNLVKPFMHQFV